MTARWAMPFAIKGINKASVPEEQEIPDPHKLFSNSSPQDPCNSHDLKQLIRIYFISYTFW